MTRFTRHAKNEMRLYKISEADVISVLESPELTGLDPHGKPIAFGAIGGRMLTVVYVMERGDTLIVTIYPRTRR